MTSTTYRPLKELAAVIILFALTGCSNNDDPTPRFEPNGTIFSDLVKQLFAANPATAEPTQINNLNFSFLNENNPDAFNSQLE